MTDKLICTVCKGSFFTISRAEQFAPLGGYGSAEFRSISNAPKTILQCIGCGTPVIPKPAYYSRGTVADVAEQDFRQSVEAGQKYRKENSIQNVANIAASPAEVREIREIVEDMRKVVSRPTISHTSTVKLPKPKAKHRVSPPMVEVPGD